mgnify:CR=1 FL=1
MLKSLLIALLFFLLSLSQIIVKQEGNITTITHGDKIIKYQATQIK